MGIILIRDEKKTEEPYKDYDVSDLLNKVDGVLAGHGFIKSVENTDEEAKINYRVYGGFKGKAVVRSPADDSEPIHYFRNNVEVSQCPVYVELSEVPDSAVSSILKDLEEI
ncbi:MAG: hypothetical protein Q8N63_08620 [Nanoarchaeota archaeon]|nr:hypothetical protein [Nanoarchaeota archaeon]